MLQIYNLCNVLVNIPSAIYDIMIRYAECLVYLVRLKCPKNYVRMLCVFSVCKSVFQYACVKTMCETLVSERGFLPISKITSTQFSVIYFRMAGVAKEITSELV